MVSDRGDILSPNQAPETIAPAETWEGIPKLSPMLSKAKPMVPRVPQDVPVTTEMRAQTRQETGKKIVGLRMISPNFVSRGTVPQRIHVLMVIPTAMNMKITGIAVVTAFEMPS